MGTKTDVSGTGGTASGGAPADGGTSFPGAALSTFMTPDSALKIELRTSPAQPIHVGPNNEGMLTITDATSGNPVDGLSISVATWMPVMRHKCSEAPVKVEAMGSGMYLLTPLVASMPGACELQLSLTETLPDGGPSAKIAVTTPTFMVAQ
ncbi:MAG TPA: FixH family protein [Polyangiaceae bacterium]|nr:FixH family protein [Polyangiaceae bacterium]